MNDGTTAFDAMALKAFLKNNSKQAYERCLMLSGDELRARECARRVLIELAEGAKKWGVSSDPSEWLDSMYPICCNDDTYAAFQLSKLPRAKVRSADDDAETPAYAKSSTDARNALNAAEWTRGAQDDFIAAHDESLRLVSAKAPTYPVSARKEPRDGYSIKYGRRKTDEPYIGTAAFEAMTMDEIVEEALYSIKRGEQYGRAPAASEAIYESDAGQPIYRSNAAAYEPPRRSAQAPVSRAQAPVARAEAPLPRAEAPLPRAEAPLPRAEAPLPRAEARAPRAEARAPRAEAPLPRAEAYAPRAEAPLSRADARAAHAEARAPRDDVSDTNVRRPSPKRQARADAREEATDDIFAQGSSKRASRAPSAGRERHAAHEEELPRDRRRATRDAEPSRESRRKRGEDIDLFENDVSSQKRRGAKRTDDIFTPKKKRGDEFDAMDEEYASLDEFADYDDDEDDDLELLSEAEIRRADGRAGRSRAKASPATVLLIFALSVVVIILVVILVVKLMSMGVIDKSQIGLAQWFNDNVLKLF